MRWCYYLILWTFNMLYVFFFPDRLLTWLVCQISCVLYVCFMSFVLRMTHVFVSLAADCLCRGIAFWLLYEKVAAMSWKLWRHRLVISGPYHWSINVFFLMLNVLWLLFVSRHLERHMTIPWLSLYIDVVLSLSIVESLSDKLAAGCRA